MALHVHTDGLRQRATMNISTPQTGFLRLPQVLQLIPVGKSTWWQWVKDGRAPKPVKLGKQTTCWKAEDIHALIAKLSAESEA